MGVDHGGVRTACELDERCVVVGAERRGALNDEVHGRRSSAGKMKRAARAENPAIVSVLPDAPPRKARRESLRADVSCNFARPGSYWRCQSRLAHAVISDGRTQRTQVSHTAHGTRNGAARETHITHTSK